MFDYGDEVQLTEESCARYEHDSENWVLCTWVFTVIGVSQEGIAIYDVEGEDGECYTFYGFELELA